MKSLPSLDDAYRMTEELLAPGCTLRELPSGCVGQSLGSATNTCGTCAHHHCFGADNQNDVAIAMHNIRAQNCMELCTDSSAGRLPASL